MKATRRFMSGRLLATPAVLDAVPYLDIIAACDRHLCCDWGDLSELDKRLNNRALLNGERLLSAYHAANGTKFWIITEADRSFTTVMLPEDY